MSYICDICNIKTSTKYNLNKHKLTESCQKIKRELEYNNKIKYIENENKEFKVKTVEKDNIILEFQHSRIPKNLIDERKLNYDNNNKFIYSTMDNQQLINRVCNHSSIQIL